MVLEDSQTHPEVTGLGEDWWSSELGSTPAFLALCMMISTWSIEGSVERMRPPRDGKDGKGR